MATYTGLDKRLAYLFQNGGGGGGSSTLSGLSDVDLNNLTDAQIIKWNAALQKWVNANESGGGGGGASAPHEIVRQTAVSIQNGTTITLNLTQKYSDPYVVALNSLPLASWGGLVYLQDSTAITYDATNDTISFDVYTNGNAAQNYNIDWLIFEKSVTGGGGGNANAWTGTAAEYEQQAAQIPDDTVVLITDDEENTEAFEIYSTAERIIGEWDGKPLYRRILPQVQISSGAVTYTHNIGIKYYINIGGTCTVNGQNTISRPFPFYQNRWSGFCGIQATDADTITFDSNWNNDTIDCYIEYTKEADYS